MTLRFMDSFDHYATADLPLKYNYSTTNIAITGSAGRRGAALTIASFSAYVLKTFDAQQTWTVGVAYKAAAFSATPMAIIALYDSGTSQIDVRVKSDGNLQVTRNSTILGTGTVPLSAGVFAYIELKVKIASSTGTIDVQVNGVSVISLSSQNTQNSGNATANEVLLGNINAAPAGTNTFDDYYVCDGQGSVNNSFLGDCRVDCYLPTGNGSNSAFTNNSGNSTNNYTHVDEASQDGDTSYVADATVNDIDSYAITGLTHTPSSIFGLQTNLIAKKDDAGARQIAPLLYRSATAYPGTGVALGTGYQDMLQIYEQDPATSATWTKTNVNATEFGVKVTA